MMNSARLTEASSRPRGRDRTIYVVDIENLVGHPAPSPSEVQSVQRGLCSAVPIVPGDLVVIGCSHCGLLGVGVGWHDVRYVVRSGPDGADLALLDVLDEDIARRFGRVVIASGDGIFAAGAASLARDCEVIVVARRDSLSARLRLAADRVLYLSDSEPDAQHQPSEAA